MDPTNVFQCPVQREIFSAHLYVTMVMTAVLIHNHPQNLLHSEPECKGSVPFQMISDFSRWSQEAHSNIWVQE